MDIVLLVSLTTWLGIYEGIIVEYPISIKKEPREHLKIRFNGRDVLALYNNKSHTIYISKESDLSSYQGKSIVLHELVHHYQNTSGMIKNYNCLAQSESLAYNIQRRYLINKGTDLLPELNNFNILMRSICQDDYY